jgi:Zn-dependent protease
VSGTLLTVNILREFNTQPLEASLYLLVLLFSFLLHEYGHAWAAIAMGDDTPLVNGKFSWNPMRYLNALGIALIVLIGFGFGGQVRTAPWKYRNRQLGEILVSSAGVLMNLALVLIAGFALRYFGLERGNDGLTGDFQAPLWAMNTLVRMLELNVTLFVFNLLPIPPLDGSSLLAAVIPGSFGDALRRTQANSSYLLIFVLVIFQQPIGQMIRAVIDFVFRILIPGVSNPI